MKQIPGTAGQRAVGRVAGYCTTALAVGKQSIYPTKAETAANCPRKSRIFRATLEVLVTIDFLDRLRQPLYTGSHCWCGIFQDRKDGFRL